MIAPMNNVNIILYACSPAAIPSILYTRTILRPIILCNLCNDMLTYSTIAALYALYCGVLTLNSYSNTIAANFNGKVYFLKVRAHVLSSLRRNRANDIPAGEIMELNSECVRITF